MGLIGSGTKDVAVAMKDMVAFFIVWTLVWFIAGQWFTAYYADNPFGTAGIIPIYILIIVLVVKVVADAFIKPEKEEKKEEK